MLLNETWLKENSHVTIPGYDLVSKPRPNKKGGGVGFLVKKGLVYRERTDLALDSKICENMVIELKCDRKSLLLCSAYRPPNTNPNDFLDVYSILIGKLKENKGKNIVIGLDHNLDLLKNATHKCTEDFIDLNLDSGLLPCITRPTRITKSTATLIDNIIVNESIFSTMFCAVITHDLSDHLPCYMEIFDQCPSNGPTESIVKRVIKENKIQKVHDELECFDWSIVQNMNCEEGFDFLHCAITQTLDKHMPIKCYSKKRTKRPEPWLMKGILRSNNKLLCLYKKTLLLEATETDRLRYTEYKRVLRRIKQRAKLNYYQTQCVEHKSNTKRLWQLINCASGKISDKSSTIECLNINGIKNYEASAIASEFAKFFSGIGLEYAAEIKEDVNYPLKHYMDKMPIHNKSLFLYATTQTEIDKLIK